MKGGSGMDNFFGGTFEDRDADRFDPGEVVVWRVRTAPSVCEAERDEVFPDDGYYDDDYDG